jgi:hypothetical protein
VPTAKGGRGPALAFLAICAAVGTGIALAGWRETWSLFGFRPLVPVFADLRTVQAGLAAAAQGLDPQVSNPGDPWGRTMNYPAVWLDIGRLLHWRSETAYLASIAAMAAAWLACCLHLLRRYPSWWLLAVIASGAGALLIERGNNDMAVFAILYLAALAAGRWPAALLVPAATLLKVYPVVALCAQLRSRRVLIAAGILSGVVLALLSPELAAIRAGTPATPTNSYGATTSAAVLARHGFALAPLALAATTIAGGLALSVLAPPLFRAGAARREQALFLTGAAIFLATFVAGTNFDYRLACLAFCVPQVLRLENIAMRGLLGAGLVLAVNQPWLVLILGEGGLLLNSIAKLALVALLPPLAIDALRADVPFLRTRRAAQ